MFDIKNKKEWSEWKIFCFSILKYTLRILIAFLSIILAVLPLLFNWSYWLLILTLPPGGSATIAFIFRWMDKYVDSDNDFLV
jgi:hypothetical protein